MKKEHIPFNTLSDLCDDVLSPAEKEEALRHVELCPGCARDYEDLGKLIRMVSCLQLFGIQGGDEFTRRTLDLIKRRKKIFYYKRFIPYAAVAAMMIFVIGIDQLREGKVGNEGEMAMSGITGNERLVKSSGESGDDISEISSSYDIRRTLSILRNNSARIVTISDAYIEGEAPVFRIDSLRREFEGAQFHQLRGWATNVNMGEGESREENSPVFHGFIFQSGNSNSRNVRFRVNLR